MEDVEREKVVEVRGLSTRFGDHVVHEDLDLDVYRGEVLGVVGGSGTGKSVLLREIAGLMRPSSGQIRVFGTDMERADEEERQSVERRWGVMFQDGALFSTLDVQGNVEAPMREQLSLDPHTRAALSRLKVSMVGLQKWRVRSFPRSCRAGCGNGPGSRARFRSTRIWSFSTSQLRGSIPSGPLPLTI